MVHKAFNLMNKIEATLNSAKDLTPAPKPSNRKSLSVPKKSLSDPKKEPQRSQKRASAIPKKEPQRFQNRVAEF
jgi:hypothetical protein